jgi:U3 small nucleolar RNA-associated protein 21
MVTNRKKKLTISFFLHDKIITIFFYVRANRTQFHNVSLRNISDEEIISTVALPTTTGLESDNEGINNNHNYNFKNEIYSNDNMNYFIIDESDEVVNYKKDEKSYETAEQLSEQMITLSLLPKSKWQNLLNLETIKVY